jgi:cytoskeletal protein RodZ
VNPGDESGWDEPPLDIQIPDDARELERDVLAYHRELRARRRQHRLRRLTRPLRGQGTVMPLLASILAVCLVAGAMLSVATFSPATGPENHNHPSATAASGLGSAAPRSTPASTAPASTGPASTAPASTGPASTAPASTGPASGTARPNGSANSPAHAGPSAGPVRPSTPGGP